MKLQPRTSWDEFCREVEAEQERTRKALAFVNAQRRPQVVTGKYLLWRILLGLGVLGLLAWLVVSR